MYEDIYYIQLLKNIQVKSLAAGPLKNRPKNIFLVEIEVHVK